MQDPGWEDNRRIRDYGKKGSPLIVLHGGPGAYGSAAPLARGLADDFTVLEPWQRGGGDAPLTVAVHVADLHHLICSRCGNKKPALVGESWGGMLALAYAAEYPHHVGPIVLVGCGTFDKNARRDIIKTRTRRISDYIKNHPEHNDDLNLSFEEQMMKWHDMTDTYEAVTDLTPDPEHEPFDMKGHIETWNDMVRCQEEGLYPQSFTNIKTPVIMLHGTHDPHPGKMTRDLLQRFMGQLEYQEFDKCGHAPAIEKYARDDFFRVMRHWLKNNLSNPGSG